MDRVADKAVKECGILFRAEMVRAILDGRKTQTRRVIKPQPGDVIFSEMDKTDLVTGWQIPGHSGIWHDDDATSRRWKCPYGRPGDRLWVREAWDVFEGPIEGDERRAFVRYAADAGLGIEDCGVLLNEEQEAVMYHYGMKRGWKPPIHMPRWASRIALEIVNVRVERVQEIADVDAKAEGVSPLYCHEARLTPYRDAFRTLWDAMRAGTEFAWDKNPWAWVIEFRRIS